MPQEPVEPSPILDYAVPNVVRKPRGWGLWVCFVFGIFLFEDVVTARLTPPGRPISSDYLLMLLLPIGAALMSISTSLPGWMIGLYGIEGACTFLLGQLSDTRLHFRLDQPNGVFWFFVNWTAFIFVSWLVCRCSLLLRHFSGG